MNEHAFRAGPVRALRVIAPAMAVWALAAAAQRVVAAEPATEAVGLAAMEAIGMTVPSREATLASVLPARIAMLLAAEGATVDAGELAIQLDEGVQLARTQTAAAAAESTLEIEVAKVRADHAQREWDRLQKLRGEDHATSKELNDARAEADLRRLEIQLAYFNHEQARRAHEREERLLEEYRLRAPFAGYVTQHLKHAGETVDQLDGILKLVCLDPLHVVVDVSLPLAAAANVGDRLRVRPVDLQWEPRWASVKLKNAVADGASQTVRLKLELANQGGGWPAGLKVVVDFSRREPAVSTAIGGPNSAPGAEGQPTDSPAGRLPPHRR